MAIAFVQEVGTVADAGSASNQLTLTIAGLGASTTVGNHLILSCVHRAFALTAISDSKGNTWQINDDTDTAQQPMRSISSVKLTSALVNGDTITVTQSSSGTGLAFEVAEYSGLDATTWFDKNAHNHGLAGTASDSGLTATTTVADELLVGNLATGGTKGTFAWEVLSPIWNPLTAVTPGLSARPLETAYRIVSATATYAVKSTWVTSRDWNTGIATYKAAAGGSPGGRYLLESSSTDGYLLESGSGVLIMEETTGGPVVADWAEAVTSSDAWTRSATLLRALTGATTSSDAWTRTVTNLRALAGAVGQSDVWTASKTFVRTLTGAVTSSDAWTRSGTFARSLAGAVGSADAWTRVATNARALAGSVGSSDAWTRTVTNLRAMTEAVGSSDAWTGLKVFIRTLTEAVTSSDAWTRSGTFRRDLTGAVTSSDAWTRSGTFLRALAETVASGDAWVGAKAGAILASFTESVTSSDAWTRVGTFGRTLTSAVTQLDTWASQLGSIVIGGLPPQIAGAIHSIARAVGISPKPDASASNPTPKGDAENPRPEH